ncbi:MAG: M15 family metallopeptidase [Treponema sp.]|nr:M15 family metallopeptidase [Treponema sp.]
MSDNSDFVLLADFVPHIVQEIRYYSTYNFVGERIDGYESPCALLTKEAARALKEVSSEMAVQGYRLKVFDAYRPVRAVKQFIFWALEDTDIRMKPYFYPEIEKQDLFKLGYIAKKSSHSRGSTVDLTLLDMQTGKEVDMGSPFDLFSEKSHPDYRGITQQQYDNRMILQRAMVRGGFMPLDCEWWHFTLSNEPFPDTYFDFPVA